MTTPRIRIVRTPANDVCVILQGLPLSGEFMQMVAGPRRFVHEHRAELRFLEQLARGYVEQFRPAPDGAPAPESPATADLAAAAVPPLVTRHVRHETAMLR